MYDAATFTFLYSPVSGSNIRVFWIFGLNVRFVERKDLLRVWPDEVFLPVLVHLRAISKKSYGSEG